GDAQGWKLVLDGRGGSRWRRRRSRLHSLLELLAVGRCGRIGNPGPRQRGRLRGGNGAASSEKQHEHDNGGGGEGSHGRELTSFQIESCRHADPDTDPDPRPFPRPPADRRTARRALAAHSRSELLHLGAEDEGALIENALPALVE